MAFKLHSGEEHSATTQSCFFVGACKNVIEKVTRVQRAHWIGLVTRSCLNLSGSCRGTELGQRPSLSSQYKSTRAG